MRSRFLVAAALAMAIGAVALHPQTLAAQSAPANRLLKINWFGPFAISPNDTADFFYSNLGSDTVHITWAFTNSETGELVCGNIGKPVEVLPGKGAEWKYSQTLTVDASTGQTIETRNCDGQRLVTDEVYFDKDFRHNLNA